ncbi:rhomboid family intramembrane serine protease [Echinicola jeungdonensis]|uniref:Rhomboid family intramembrane serine protease n=1 Tax=Echinicola jeungdonensis TaxID=709343 RepID=A0ABV5J560_9BACT|nr:rhomboid family intramembrane serine protease [Echinicola jeungdonensis]MDN3668644.1 rhomboid family intramembrane serine protease [Echinicola jeungdonensis]
MELSATVVLIIITCISSYYAWKSPAFLERSLFSPYQIHKKGEYGRFILSGFIHRDSIHLLFNMFTFYFFGGLVEQFLTYRLGIIPGIAVFVTFYLAAIVVADIPTFIKHKENYHYNALGASGGVAAAVFASIILMPLADICLFGLICLPGFVLGFLFLIYSIYKSKQETDGINHDAHLYGALFGIVFILILSPSSAIHFIDQIKDFRLF